MSQVIKIVPSIKVQLIKSPIGCKKSHRATLKGLGLRKIRSTSILEATPSILGMINKVSYLIRFV